VAYKHDAVVLDSAPDSLLCIFGLERANEDDLAQAMAYALDALEIARSLSPQGIVVRLGARQGIVARRRGWATTTPRAISCWATPWTRPAR